MTSPEEAVCPACGAAWPPQAQACAQCGSPPVQDETAPATGPDYLQQIREQQRRVAEQLKPLERGRSWWKKYF